VLAEGSELMFYPKVELVSQQYQEVLGIARHTVYAGGVLKVVVGGVFEPMFEASEDIPIGSLVALTRSRTRRIKDWLIRRLR
jgi:hypothetical protein